MNAKRFASALALSALISTGLASADLQISVPTPIPQSDAPDYSDLGVNIGIGLGVAVVAGAAIFFAVQRKSPKK